MDNLLIEYMNRRFGTPPEILYQKKENGPVITISRQTGCGATAIAFKLADALTRMYTESGKNVSWNYMNREILETAAGKLNLEPHKLHQVLTDHQRGIMDEVVEAFSTHTHKSDMRIMKTLQDVIREFAEQGHVVIVGRGGAAISHDIPKSLHIRIEAPEEWRVEQIMKRLSFSKSYATDYITKNDEDRHRYVQKMLQGKKATAIYDMVINRSRFTDAQIVQLIIEAARIKNLF